MYDSKCSGGDLDTSMTHQLALVYCALITVEEDGEEVDPHLIVHIPPVQQQKGPMTVEFMPLHLHFMLHLEMT